MQPDLSLQLVDPDLLLRTELEKVRKVRPRPVSLSEMLEMTDPMLLGKFVHREAPVRYAERIKWIEDIPNWQKIDELVEVHSRQCSAFRDLRLVKRQPDLSAFTAAIENILDMELDVPHVLARGMYRLSKARGCEDWGPSHADPWLDRYFLSSIGTDMLLNQFLACVNLDEGGVDYSFYHSGIVDPECDIAEICESVAEEVVELCAETTGKTPLVDVDVHAPWEDEAGSIQGFSFIPGFMRYILTEILKNSCRATAELVTSDEELKRRPVKVVICADRQFVAIRVSDRARGIPFEHRNHVFSYLYSTWKRAGDADDERWPPRGADAARDLAGYGVGLPLSRLYAAYLGGSLELTSLPGYGVSVDLFFRRLSFEQLEVVPSDRGGVGAAYTATADARPGGHWFLE